MTWLFTVSLLLSYNYLYSVVILIKCVLILSMWCSSSCVPLTGWFPTSRSPWSWRSSGSVTWLNRLWLITRRPCWWVALGDASAHRDIHTLQCPLTVTHSLWAMLVLTHTRELRNWGCVRKLRQLTWCFTAWWVSHKINFRPTKRERTWFGEQIFIYFKTNLVKTYIYTQIDH